MRKRFQYLTVLSLSAWIGLSLLPSPTLACTDYTPIPLPDLWISGDDGDPCTNDIAIVTFHDYTTFASTTGNFCGCVLNVPLGLGVVTSARIVERGTNNPVPGFPFVDSTAVTNGFDAIVSADWQGFKADVDAVVGAGIAVDLRFEVALNTGDNCPVVVDQLINHLQTAPAAVGTAEVDASGEPIGHITILPVGNVLEDIVFDDGFESGNTAAWDLTMG